MDKNGFLFRADGRLLVRTDDGVVHEATVDEQTEAALALWPSRLGMGPRWGQPRA